MAQNTKRQHIISLIFLWIIYITAGYLTTVYGCWQITLGIIMFIVGHSYAIKIVNGEKENL